MASNPHHGLLLVLYSAWFALAISSVLLGQPELFGKSQAKVPIAEFFRSQTSQASSVDPATVRAVASIGVGEPQPNGASPEVPHPDARQPDASKQRILLFGDSMVPILMPRLADYCLENGHELFPVVWYGSTIIYWGWEDKLERLLVEFSPTMVIA